MGHAACRIKNTLSRVEPLICTSHTAAVRKYFTSADSQSLMEAFYASYLPQIPHWAGWCVWMDKCNSGLPDLPWQDIWKFGAFSILEAMNMIVNVLIGLNAMDRSAFLSHYAHTRLEAQLVDELQNTSKAFVCAPRWHWEKETKLDWTRDWRVWHVWPMVDVSSIFLADFKFKVPRLRYHGTTVLGLGGGTLEPTSLGSPVRLARYTSPRQTKMVLHCYRILW